jgi:hypothetical protein
MPPFTDADGAGYLGAYMGDICENKFEDRAQNHCAHFVSHALGITFPLLCGDLKSATKGTGATIRCDELFNQLTNTGLWADRPMARSPLLVFVTFEQNVRNGFMGPMPSKHVGIWVSQSVYNFSNSHHFVIQTPSPEEFLATVGGYYKKIVIAHPLGRVGSTARL